MSIVVDPDNALPEDQHDFLKKVPFFFGMLMQTCLLTIAFHTHRHFCRTLFCDPVFPT